MTWAFGVLCVPSAHMPLWLLLAGEDGSVPRGKPKCLSADKPQSPVDFTTSKDTVHGKKIQQRTWKNTSTSWAAANVEATEVGCVQPLISLVQALGISVRNTAQKDKASAIGNWQG